MEGYQVVLSKRTLCDALGLLNHDIIDWNIDGSGNLLVTFCESGTNPTLKINASIGLKHTQEGVIIKHDGVIAHEQGL